MKVAGIIDKGCDLARQSDIVVIPDILLHYNTILPLIINLTDIKTVARNHGCNLMTRNDLPLKNNSFKMYTAKMMDRGRYLKVLYKTATLPFKLAKIYDKWYGFLSENEYTAIHMRIEKDWYPYCGFRSKRIGGVKTCFTPEEIFTRVKMSRTSLKKNIVLLYGDTNFDAVMDTAKQFFPNVTITHARSLEKLRSTLSYNEQAALDFWLAIRAYNFIGIMSSTFSNGAVQARFYRNGHSMSLTYSCPHVNGLGKRIDNGVLRGNTDMGNCLHGVKNNVLTNY